MRIMIADPSLEVCVPRHLSRLWGRSTAVTAVSSRQNRDAPAETLLGLRQGQLYVAGDSDILLSRSSRGEGLFCPSIYIIAIKSQIVQKNQKNFINFTISPQKLSNFAIIKLELLKKLIAEQVQIYRHTNVVKSQKFSEIMQRAMNSYLNGMLTNEQVIEELLNLAKQMATANKEGEQLGLTADELAFYDALTKPQAIKDFYENTELIAITKELADTLRKNRTIDWQKRDSARAKMRMMIKRLLKRHRYPPEGMDDAVQTVMTQCELWTDNNDMESA